MTSLQIPKWLVHDPETLATVALRLTLTLVVAFVVQRIGFLIVRRAETLIVRAAHDHPSARQRARTIGQTVRHLITSLVAAAALLHALEVFGWDVKPLLVGASLLGAGLAFGAQSLVRDVIAGASILIEDQFSVGDTIEISGGAATVEEVTLRMTRLRDFQGRLLFVPNGEMRIVVNLSRDWHRAIVDLPLSPNQDLARALEAAKRATQDVAANPEIKPHLLEPPQVIGLERVGADGVVLRMVARTAPGAPSAATARELRRLALEQLRRAGVRIAPETAGSPTSTPGAGGTIPAPGA